MLLDAHGSKDATEHDTEWMRSEFAILSREAHKVRVGHRPHRAARPMPRLRREGRSCTLELAAAYDEGKPIKGQSLHAMLGGVTSIFQPTHVSTVTALTGMRKTYVLNLFSPETWSAFRAAGCIVVGKVPSAGRPETGGGSATVAAPKIGNAHKRLHCRGWRRLH